MQRHHTSGTLMIDLTVQGAGCRVPRDHLHPGWNIKQRSLVWVLSQYIVRKKLPKKLVSRTIYWAAQQKES